MELETTIKKLLNSPQQTYFIWGAGVLGKNFVEKMKKEEIKILGFIDSNPDKQGKIFCGFSTFSPEIISQYSDAVIIVATGWIEEVTAYCKNYGFVYGENCFAASDFFVEFFWQKYHTLNLSAAHLFITSCCTLKCKNCAGLIPYVKKFHVSMEDIKKNLISYFRYVDTVELLAIGGGDLILHPQLEEIISWIGEEYYQRRVQTIEIYTNAIILPSQALISILKKYHVVLRVTDYSETLPDRQHLKEFVQLCQENQLEYDIAHFDNWMNIGYPQMTNDMHTEKEFQELFRTCNKKFHAVIFQQKLYYCSISFAMSLTEKYPDWKDIYFDMSKPYDAAKKKELKRFTMGMLPCGYLSSCTACNGSENNNLKYVKVAEQLMI